MVEPPAYVDPGAGEPIVAVGVWLVVTVRTAWVLVALPEPFDTMQRY